MPLQSRLEYLKLVASKRGNSAALTLETEAMMQLSLEARREHLARVEARHRPTLEAAFLALWRKAKSATRG